MNKKHSIFADTIFKYYKRIVIKIGSSLVTDTQGVHDLWLKKFAEDIAYLVEDQCQVIIVSSGSIAIGRRILNYKHKNLTLSDQQAAAACGQIGLAQAWQSALKQQQLNSGQILLTLGDTEDRRRHLNARATILKLADYNTIPIINENDTIATDEIRYGDNDRLAARVATMISADLLILLTDQDGLYTKNPKHDPSAQHIPYIETITPEITAMAEGAGSKDSRGGMLTKLLAAQISIDGGTDTIITNGTYQNPIRHLLKGGLNTLIKSEGKPLQARKRWILGSLRKMGKIHIDSGAEQALMKGKSLLPAGITKTEGAFDRGDVVEIINHSGQKIGVGISSHSADQAILIIGKRSDEIQEMLQGNARPEFIHRDDLVL